MKDSLQVGLRFEHSYRVPANKTVPALYPESPDFQAMPAVFATGFMVGFLEWACILALKPHLDWPAEQSLGTRIDVSHEAPTLPGSLIVAQVELLEMDGRRLRFAVQAHEGTTCISRGTHERHIIDRARFEARLAAQAGKAAGDTPRKA
jgi:fluoroacetyl-CoA thioesterase